MITLRYKKQALIDSFEARVTAWPGISAEDHERGGREFV